MAGMDPSLAVERLVTGSPDYRELRELYMDLRTLPDDPIDPENIAARYALAQVIGEIIDYLDFVGEELEKSVGLTQDAERMRILDSLKAPASQDCIEQVVTVIFSWQTIDTVTNDQLKPVEP